MYPSAALAGAVCKQEMVTVSCSVLVRIMMGTQTPPGAGGEKTRQDCNRYLYGMKCRSSTCQKIPAEEIGDTVRVNHLIL